ncbi:MAG: membrane protein insertion efficiency factor YidD [Clostridiales bacterium]|nr:membrane protein insertion efficiency factor YidD [Clostridiales bacterium]
MIKNICLRLILFYKKNISPLKNSHCRFVPTCSMYTYEAIEKYGVIKGCVLGGIRILKCNPLTSKRGYAPLKENFRGEAKWLI